jgi:hypothetical protein
VSRRRQPPCRTVLRRSKKFWCKRSVRPWWGLLFSLLASWLPAFAASTAPASVGPLVAASAPEPQPNPQTSSFGLRPALPAGCSEALSTPWPTVASRRRALIQKLQDLRPTCIESAPLLGLLGALLLEDGDPAQALIWLERSLLLEPNNLGVVADHAFALSQLGEPAALDALRFDWKDRPDLPVALRDRMFPAEGRNRFALPAVRLGQTRQDTWGVAGDISLLAGHENNLDRSPRLKELTLTIPGEPFVLPVDSPKRAGAALAGSATFLVAYAPSAATVLRTGLALNARHAQAHAGTDWQQVQWAANASHSWNGLRAQLDLALAWFGGRLGEPYRQDRLSIAADVNVSRCRLRLSTEADQRKMSSTVSLNAHSTSTSVGVMCHWREEKNWGSSVSHRNVRDRPETELRPGGEQRTRSSLVRLFGVFPWTTKLELAARYSVAQDDFGYNPLLLNNAVRQLRSRQLSLELAHPLPSATGSTLELVLQWEKVRQTSNLALFSFQADSVYGGLRWSW